MLEQMRAMAKSPVAMVLIGLLILSFAVWGISDVFRGGQGDAVVIVGSKKVSVQEYANAWDRELNRVIQQSEGKVTSQQARDFGLADQLLQRLTNNAALDAKAEQLGIGMSNRLIAREIRKIEAFQNPITEKFGEEQYRSTLANARYTPKQFERNVRGDLLRAQMTDPIITGVIAPRAMAKIEWAYRGEQRQITEIIVPETLIPDASAPTEEQLVAYLEAHKDRFKTPELRGASLVLISASDLAAEMDVPEDKIKELYEFQKDSLSEPETRSWVQISTEDEATAKIIAARLKAGETAEEITKSLNLNPPITFEKTIVTNTPDDQIAEAVFEAKDKAIGVTQGRLTWAAWKLNAITPAVQKTYADVHDTLRESFIKEEAADKLYELVGLFEDARASGATLEEAAETTGLLLLSLPPVDPRGNDKDHKPVAAYENEAEILKTVFETDEAVESEILETKDGEYYAIRTDSIIPPTDPALADIRDRVAEAWRKGQKSEWIKTFADEIKSALVAGEDANAIAAKYPGISVETALLQRGQDVPPMTQRHGAQMFGLAVGEVAMAPDQSDKNLIIARLDKIIPANEVPDAVIEIGRRSIGEALSADMQTEFLRGMLDQFNIRQDARLKALALGLNPEG
jgi:peptidyl-prolyl cis-trans isomerase D